MNHASSPGLEPESVGVGEYGDEYEVDEIVGKRVWGGNGAAGRRTCYTIRWKAGDVTEEEVSRLEGCEEAIAEYEASLAGEAHALSIACIGEAERAVAELLRAQKLGGTVDEWVPGYEKEMKEVGEKRFEEVTDERERQAVLRSGVAMRLRTMARLKSDDDNESQAPPLQREWQTVQSVAHPCPPGPTQGIKRGCPRLRRHS